MRMNRLNKLYYIQKNIKELEGELAELNNLGSAPIDDMPKGDRVSNPTERFVMKKNRILEKMNDAYEEYLSEYEKISDFINKIDDEEIKLIARLRFIKQKDWIDIAAEISPEDKLIHRTTPIKKLKNYLNSKEGEKNGI